MNTNHAFKNANFWLAYESLYHENNEGKGSETWLAQFAKDFAVKTEHKRHITPAAEIRDCHLNGLAIHKIETTFNACDESYTKHYQERFDRFKAECGALAENQLEHFEDDVLEYDSTTVSFALPLPHNYLLTLILVVEPEEHSIPDQSLYLAHGDERFQLGYWDTAHWLPFCLRLDELNQLTQFWQTQTGLWRDHADIIWALLAKFIGITNEKDAVFIRKKYQHTLHTLGVQPTQTFTVQSRCTWQQTEKGYEFIGTKLPEYLESSIDHSNDAEVNIEAIKMMSYSLRKQPYINAECDQAFPFSHWKTVMKSL